MSTSYSPVTISKGPFKIETLQRMAENAQWLFEHTPKMKYQGAVNRTEGLKIIAGKSYYPPNDVADRQDVSVYFGGFFSVGCNPIVVANSEPIALGYRRLVTVRGIGTYNIDNRGFIGHVSNQENALSDQTKIVGGGYMHWISVGW